MQKLQKLEGLKQTRKNDGMTLSGLRMIYGISDEEIACYESTGIPTGSHILDVDFEAGGIV